MKKFLLPVVALAALSFAACSDWTDTESVDLDYPSLETQNPALYKKYLESLREYKAGEHKIVIATMDNTLSAPSQQNQHLTNMPDSVDLICLANPDNLHPVLVSEFAKVREKGTRLIYNIGYSDIEARWNEIIEEEEANKPEEPETPETPEDPEDPTDPEEVLEARFLEFCREQTAALLTVCDKYGYDGLQVSYNGKFPDALPEAEKERYTARQEAFFQVVKAWYETHKSKLLIFQGEPVNLIDKSILQECIYIVIPALKATSADEMSFAVMMSVMQDVPTDRFIIGVKTPSITDPTDESGYFAGYEADGKTRLQAAKGAAGWVVMPVANYTKMGISVADAQNDYYNLTLVYKNIREAINIMNPTPKN
ncbi:glycoside hydrolase family 18 [uncultured Alistipes sp.]|uniref:glycoside hydrolase family 18 n=1 Tax=uncultured Alistipes sp. TaxID=538949 RepID=UPI0025E18B1B|nr:glycoside hydrolase family 18 [uncultured Alistipes sp.]